MSTPIPADDPRRSRPDRPRATAWQRIWPAALAVAVSAGTAYGLEDGRDAAPVVTASGLVYLAAAATGRRGAAWAGFAATFVLIGLSIRVGFDAVPWMIGVAAVLLAVGVVRRRSSPWWSFPLQAAAMVVLGAVAVVASRAAPAAGGLLVAAALLGHAAWDVHHLRADRVVDRSLAAFCAVLDVLVAIAVAAVAFGVGGA